MVCYKTATKLQVVTKFNVTKSRLDCTHNAPVNFTFSDRKKRILFQKRSKRLILILGTPRADLTGHGHPTLFGRNRLIG